MFSFWPIKGSDDEENYKKKQEEGCASIDAHVRPDTNTDETNKDAIPFNHISWLAKKLEHSFSDVSQFNINTRHPPTTKPTKLKGLRADLVHLHGVGLHSKKPTTDLHLHLHNEEKEGFQFRSIQRSISSIESAPNSGANGINDNTKTIVVVPSMDLDGKELIRMCDCIEYYEERPLYYLLMANDRSVRIIYLTSNHVEEKVIGYYLSLCQNEESDDEHHRSDRFCDIRDKLTRVFIVSVPSKQYIPLSEKFLEDSKLVSFVRELIHQRKTPQDSAGLAVFTGSDSADKLSHELGVRLLEASGDSLHFGTKQGSREIFAACDIPHPAGTPSKDDDDLLTYGNKHGEEKSYWAHNHRYIRSSHSLSIGISRQILVHGVRPKKWMVKLNQGFSGKGNASINLQTFQDCHYSPTEDTEKDILQMAAKIEKEFETMKFEDPAMTWHGDGQHVGFQKQIERLGVIAEAFIEGEVPTSPSIQAVIEPNDDDNVGGRVSIVSTHEQLLYGQVYHGCINPASEQYRAQIMDMGLKVGKFMLARGVRGHFACDFICTQKPDGSWDLNALEINLRQGGTSHPQATMALLCGGCICSDGVFRTNDNEVRTYVATDWHSVAPCSESHLIDAIECRTDPLARRIRWNKTEHIGVVFHLMKFATKGRVGCTAIGRNIEESQLLFNATKEFLLQMK